MMASASGSGCHLLIGQLLLQELLVNELLRLEHLLILLKLLLLLHTAGWCADAENGGNRGGRRNRYDIGRGRV